MDKYKFIKFTLYERIDILEIEYHPHNIASKYCTNSYSVIIKTNKLLKFKQELKNKIGNKYKISEQVSKRILDYGIENISEIEINKKVYKESQKEFQTYYFNKTIA